MTVQNSAAVRNAQADAWESAIGTAAKIRIYSGSMPADCATARSGTMLAEFTLASDWSAAASGGVKSLSSLPLSATAAAAGTAGYYSIMDSAGTTCHEQGTVATSGADMTIDNASITSGQTVRITAFSKTWPGA